MKKYRKLKRVLLILAILAAVGLLMFAGINLHVKNYAEKYILTDDEAEKLQGVDCIIVLGAHVRSDGSPSYMLESRLNKAIELYENGVSDRFLMSGDHGTKEYDEVNNMMNYVLENTAVDKDRVFLDHAGFSTYESGYRAKAIFKIDKGVFVTQKYHLYRTVYTARKNGIEAYGVASDDRDWPGMLYYKFRESLAVFKDFWCCVFGVKPTYLGEAIPVSGSAALSHDIID